jgi:hypothetical protein
VTIVWPSTFPKGCPPSAAQPPSQQVFRLVRAGTPAATDFVPYAIERPELFQKGPPCHAHGLSVFDSLEKCRAAERRSPSLRGRLSAQANLAPEHGLILQTPGVRNTGHITWWVSPALDPVPLFAVVLVGD